MALNKQWLPNCLQMICVPPPSVSHSRGLSWHILISPGWRLAEGPARAEGSGQQHDRASFLVFLSPHLFQLSWHVTMYGPQRHLLAIRRLLVDSVCQGPGGAPAPTLPWLPLVKSRERLRCWHTNACTIRLPLVLHGLAQRDSGQWPPNLVSLWWRS